MRGFSKAMVVVNPSAEQKNIVLVEELFYADQTQAPATLSLDSRSALVLFKKQAFCGNGQCESNFGENCSNCPRDCGECIVPTSSRSADQGAGGQGGQSINPFTNFALLPTGTQIGILALLALIIFLCIFTLRKIFSRKTKV